MKRMLALITAVALLFWFGLSMIFIVDQREYAVISSFGELKRIIATPGVELKWPMPFEQLVRLDKRIQTINYTEADGYTVADSPNLLISLMIKWRIANPRKYFMHFGTNAEVTQNKLSQAVGTALDKQLTQLTLANLLSSDQSAMLVAVREQVQSEMTELGVEMVDVRFQRIDLPAQQTKLVYQRMQAEQQQMLAQLSASGLEQAQKMRAQAERQRQDILALGYKKAQSIKGEGDAQASAIEAEALQSAPQFYHFFKSLEVYRRSFSARDVMVVDPSSEFFRFMRQPLAAQANAESKRAK